MDFKQFRLLYKLISKNKKLSEKRHPMFDRNRFMKIFTYGMIAFMACYLIFFGVVLGNAFLEGSIEACDMLNQGILFILIFEFFVRFGMQETPAQEVKPYKLMPIPVNAIVHIFLIKRGWNWGNAFFLFFFIPFGFLTVAQMPYFGWISFIGYMIGVWLLFVLNAYWYLIWRTLINQHFLYLLVPFLFYAVLIIFGMVLNDWLFTGSMLFMRGFIVWNPLCFVAVLLCIAVLYFVNLWMQRKFLYAEIAKVEKVKKVKSQEMSFLNRYGVIGEYLKLEIKSIARNNVVRKIFISGLTITLLFCAVTAFTTAYDASFMRVFICVYCFAVYGIMTLTNVMGVEGNYIDGLMSRKESVLSLLKAKYYFYIAMLLIPTLSMIAPVATGKYTIYEMLGCLFFTPGCIFPCLFILAIFNNTTLNLTQKLQQKTTNSKAQFFVSMAAMFVPMGIMYVLVMLLGNMWGGIVMMALGLVGVALHHVWLKAIYKQFMIRRYENMSSFRATRNA